MITVIYIWDIKKNFLSLLRALRHLAADRRELKSDPAIDFFKLLGTGSGITFTPRDADWFTWALLVTIAENELDRFDDSENIGAWRKISTQERRIIVQPISAHGLWSGVNPFENQISRNEKSSEKWSGKVIALTRARIALSKNFIFWRAVPPVTQSLLASPGLIWAIGIGEAPLGLQGTLSVWENAQSLRAFAYQSQAHSKVIEATPKIGWYTEELFARFALLEDRVNEYI